MISRHLRIVFMGTPEFAVPSLEILKEAGYPIAGVITAPDKPGGRGLKNTMISPVKSFALTHGIPVLQPTNLKSKKFIDEVRSLEADLQVVVAFKDVTRDLVEYAAAGHYESSWISPSCIQGAAPIQWAIIRGEQKTGLTTFMLEHEIDKGQILAQREMPILNEDDAGTLHDRMMFAGAGLVLGSVDQLQTGKTEFNPQNDRMSSTAPKIQHEDARINWHQPVAVIQNLIRGMSPYPGAWTLLDGMEWKILKSSVYSDQKSKKNGLLAFENKKLIAQASDGELEILEVQLAGKKRMTARDFINGYKIKDWSMT